MDIKVDGELWQWDTDRTLTITDALPTDLVDIAGKCSCMALTVAVGADGTCTVPNQLLTDANDRLKVFIRRGNQTIYARLIPVKKRPKPADYVETVTPTLGYQSLRKELLDMIDELEERIDGAGLIKSVASPLSVDEQGTLRVDIETAGRGTQITVGTMPPTSGVKAGDSFINTLDMTLLVAKE